MEYRKKVNGPDSIDVKEPRDSTLKNAFLLVGK